VQTQYTIHSTPRDHSCLILTVDSFTKINHERASGRHNNKRNREKQEWLSSHVTSTNSRRKRNQKSLLSSRSSKCHYPGKIDDAIRCMQQTTHRRWSCDTNESRRKNKTLLRPMQVLLVQASNIMQQHLQKSMQKHKWWMDGSRMSKRKCLQWSSESYLFTMTIYLFRIRFGIFEFKLPANDRRVL
jgi:hypothetical protein